jgi:colicin import membrane protein
MASNTYLGHSGNEKQSLIYTIIISIAIALILFFWTIRYEDNVDPGGGGIEIDFGNSEYGLGDDNSSLGEPAPAPTETYVPPSTPTPKTPTPTKVPEIKPIAPSAPKANTNTNNTMTSSNADAIAIEKKKKEEEKIQKAADAQAKAAAQAKATADANARAEAERKRKAEEEFTQKMQGGISGINKGNGTGGTGSGSGQGNTKPGGNQGDPSGSMSGGNGTGGSGGGTGGGQGTGSGSGSGSGSNIGGNHTLAGRNMISKPALINNSTTLGTIKIKVSVDKNGNVLSAAFAAQGSTTTDTYLVNLSVNAAKKIKFSPSSTSADEQFGVVTFNYNP